MQNFDFVIIGSGIAGVSAAETLRKQNKNCSVGLISDEPHDPYSKVLLPFWLKGKISREKLFIRGTDFWKNHTIHFVNGEVIQVDRSSRVVKLQDGQEIFYRKLLIASGAHAKKIDLPGFDLPHVFSLRNLDDAAAIKNFFDSWKNQRMNEKDFGNGIRPVIYGASFIALEYAGIFAHFGISAQIMFRGSYFWSRLLDRQGGKLIEGFLEQAGMEVHQQEEIQRIVSVSASQSRRTGQPYCNVVTHKASYATNFLGLGIGLEPNLAFACEAGLVTNQGIITNEFLETNDPDIFAAGDVAEFYDVTIGRQHVLGNWLNSDIQGRTAALNMLGAHKPFELVSFYSFTFDGKKIGSETRGKFDICAIGDTEGAANYSTEAHQHGATYIKIFMRDDVCVGAILINYAQMRQKIAKAIKQKMRASDLMQTLAI